MKGRTHESVSDAPWRAPEVTDIWVKVNNVVEIRVREAGVDDKGKQNAVLEIRMGKEKPEKIRMRTEDVWYGHLSVYL